jgi:hypothetical protein
MLTPAARNASRQEPAMTALACVLSLAAAIYLIAAIAKPEWFS